MYRAQGSIQTTIIEHAVNLDWQELDAWAAEQLQNVLDYCAHHNWQVIKVSEEQSRLLEPVLSVWFVTFVGLKGAKSIWIITGDLPIDSISIDAAKSARDALLIFSRKFLRRAQQLKSYPATAVDHRKCAQSEPIDQSKGQMQQLVKAAADLLVLYHEQEIWT